MPFLSLDDFRVNSLGADLSAYRGPEGDAALHSMLTKALVMIEDYVGFPLRMHSVPNETAPVMGASLPFFPKQWPIRTISSYTILAWAQQGNRQSWTLPAYPAESGGFRQRLPLIVGNVVIDRTHNFAQVSSYAGALGFPWTTIMQMATNIVVNYTAGFDADDPDWDTSVFDSRVVAAPAPTTTSFRMVAGDGPFAFIGRPVTVGAQTSTVLSISTDDVTVSPPFDAPPAPGEAISQIDGIVLPPPDWLVELQRDTARDLINLANATAGGAAGVGSITMGDLKWVMPPRTAPDLPQPVKDTLDRHFELISLEMA